MRNGHDAVFNICRDLLRIDNRPEAEIAEECGLSIQTIKHIKAGDRAFVRSTTVDVIARTMHKTITIKNIRS